MLCRNHWIPSYMIGLAVKVHSNMASSPLSTITGSEMFDILGANNTSSLTSVMLAPSELLALMTYEPAWLLETLGMCNSPPLNQTSVLGLESRFLSDSFSHL